MRDDLREAAPPSTIEAVARAIARQAHVDDGYARPTDEALDGGMWRNHVKQAQAAIAALQALGWRPPEGELEALLEAAREYDRLWRIDAVYHIEASERRLLDAARAFVEAARAFAAKEEP